MSGDWSEAAVTGRLRTLNSLENVMNRCITCAKPVTVETAESRITRDGETFLVCCRLCEKEFERDQDHYIAVARSLIADSTGTSKVRASKASFETDELSENYTELIRLIGNLKDSSDELRRSQRELTRHFNLISTSGGLEGLRNALRDHRELMESFEEDMRVHSGICRFALAVARSSAVTTSNA